MIRAHVDTPWGINPDTGANSPALVWDPAFSAMIKGWRDVTGEEFHEYPPGSGTMAKGGCYAQATGLAKSNEMDYMTIEIQVENEADLAAIDAVDDYYVYYGEDEEGVDKHRGKNTMPDASAWGQFRSKMARRGVSQAWIDKYIDKREIMWGTHDHNVREGYLGTDNVIEPEEVPSPQ